MNQLGYIMLYRKIKDWRWYRDGNTFRLFLHLLLEASRKQYDFEMHKLLPGQVITGRKALAMDLGLSERKIRTSINKLKTTNEVTVKTTNKFSIITICNWDTYQHKEQDQRPAKRPAVGPASDQQPTTLQEVNKLISKEDIEVAAISSAAKRQNVFYNSLIPFLTEHPPERIKAFYDYWSELNPSKTKMRFELQKTWESKKRLATWASREKLDGKEILKPKTQTVNY